MWYFWRTNGRTNGQGDPRSRVWYKIHKFSYIISYVWARRCHVKSGKYLKLTLPHSNICGIVDKCMRIFHFISLLHFYHISFFCYEILDFGWDLNSRHLIALNRWYWIYMPYFNIYTTINQKQEVEIFLRHSIYAKEI